MFDHGWAEAWERAGGQYYPKLQVAVPFTPVPGPRLLGNRPQQLLTAIEAVTVQNDISSAHITFIDEAGARECERRNWLIRHGVQYHWFNRGYSSFDDFLASLTSRKRKSLRKERAAARRRARDQDPSRRRDRSRRMGRDVGLLSGHGSRKWGRPYLTRSSSTSSASGWATGCSCFSLAADGLPIAGALNFIGSDTLYGRYWGCTEEVPFLHFELCYYQAIEWAIDHGLHCVQAGAQGEHKVARGYEPVVTMSAHFIPNRSFRHAVARVPRSRARRAFQPRSNGSAATCPTAPRRPNRRAPSGRSRRPCRDTLPAS